MLDKTDIEGGIQQKSRITPKIPDLTCKISVQFLKTRVLSSTSDVEYIVRPQLIGVDYSNCEVVYENKLLWIE